MVLPKAVAGNCQLPVAESSVGEPKASAGGKGPGAKGGEAAGEAGGWLGNLSSYLSGGSS